jgi:hypothetical protein
LKVFICLELIRKMGPSIMGLLKREFNVRLLLNDIIIITHVASSNLNRKQGGVVTLVPVAALVKSHCTASSPGRRRR